MTNPRGPDVTDRIEVGRGGFGVVYRARQEQFRRDVAVKVITATLDERARGRFTQECRALGQLSGHPHIVPVYDGGIDTDGHGFLIMPFLGGGSLADRLTRSGPVAWREAVDIGVRLAGALQTAHDAGILHRDIKPANVLVDEYGAPRLADFGQARFADADLTRTGEVTATPAYAAPEIIDGRTATPQADVYSLAATVMALVLGRAPFDAGDDNGAIAPVLYRVMSEPPPNLRPVGVPDEVARVLEVAMAKDAVRRPESALALGIALQRAQQALQLAPTPLSVAGTQLLPPPLGDRSSDPGRTEAVQSAPAGRPERTQVAPFPGGQTAALPFPGHTTQQGPAVPGRRRRALVVGLSLLVVAALVAGGVVLIRELTEPSPAADLLGSDIVLAADDLPGAGWEISDSAFDGPLTEFFATSPELLSCLVLPVVDSGGAEGSLAARDLELSDVYLAEPVRAQTAGIITTSTVSAQAIVQTLEPPGRCPSELQSLAYGLAVDVDFEPDVRYEAVPLSDLPGAVTGSGQRVVVPLSGSDTGASEFVVEFVFLAAGSAVAAVGLAAYGEVPDELRASVVEQLVDKLTE